MRGHPGFDDAHARVAITSRPDAGCPRLRKPAAHAWPFRSSPAPPGRRA